MNRIYALTINGTMYFLSGSIPENLYSSFDTIAKNFSINSNIQDELNICQEFIKYIFENYNLNLEILKVNHVFRIQ